MLETISNVVNIMIRITITVLVFSVVIYALDSVIKLINTIKVYFVSKAQYYASKTDKLNELDLSKAAKDARAILQLLDSVILNEVRALLKTYVTLNQAYPVTKLQDDIQAISNNVFSFIKKDSFQNLKFLDEEYLMTYITQSVSYNLISSVVQFNATSRL